MRVLPVPLMVGGLAGNNDGTDFRIFYLVSSTNQSACGLALTIFGIGISAFIGQNLYVSMALPGLEGIKISLISEIPVLGLFYFSITMWCIYPCWPL